MIGEKKTRADRKQQRGLNDKDRWEQCMNKVLQRFLDIARFGEYRQILQYGAASICLVGSVIICIIDMMLMCHKITFSNVRRRLLKIAVEASHQGKQPAYQEHLRKTAQTHARPPALRGSCLAQGKMTRLHYLTNDN